MLDSPIKFRVDMLSGGPSALKSGLDRTNLFLRRYEALPSEQKNLLISRWLEASESMSNRFVSKYRLQQVGLEYQQFTKGMSSCDMTKLDLLMLTDGRAPLFHTENWLRKLYGIPNSTKFTIPMTRKWPPESSGFSSGAPAEPPAASFDSFYKDERALVRAWVRSGFHFTQYPEMSETKMAKKIERWLKLKK